MRAVIHTKTGELEVVKQQSVEIPYYAGAFTKQEDYLQYAKELAEEGNLHAYIDKVYSINETVDAIQYLLTSHASGKVVIKTDF